MFRQENQFLRTSFLFVLIFSCANLESIFAQAFDEDTIEHQLHSQDLRPTIRQMLKAYCGSMPEENPFGDIGEQEETLKIVRDEGANMIAAYEYAHPGSQWGFVGRDMQIGSLLFESFYLAIGQKNRVHRLNYSGNIPAHTDSVLRLIEASGMNLNYDDLSHSWVVVTDSTTWKGDSKGAGFARRMFEELYDDFGFEPAEIIRSINYIPVKASYSTVEISPDLDLDTYFEEIEWNAPTSRPSARRAIPALESPVKLSHGVQDGQEWHGSFSSIDPDTYLSPTPGASTDHLYNRASLLAMAYEVYQVASAQDFVEEVKRVAWQDYGYRFPLTRADAVALRRYSQRSDIVQTWINKIKTKRSEARSSGVSRANQIIEEIYEIQTHFSPKRWKPVLIALIEKLLELRQKGKVKAKPFLALFSFLIDQVNTTDELKKALKNDRLDVDHFVRLRNKKDFESQIHKSTNANDYDHNLSKALGPTYRTRLWRIRFKKISDIDEGLKLFGSLESFRKGELAKLSGFQKQAEQLIRMGADDSVLLAAIDKLSKVKPSRIAEVNRPEFFINWSEASGDLNMETLEEVYSKLYPFERELLVLRVLALSIQQRSQEAITEEDFAERMAWCLSRYKGDRSKLETAVSNADIEMEDFLFLEKDMRQSRWLRGQVPADLTYETSNEEEPETPTDSLMEARRIFDRSVLSIFPDFLNQSWLRELQETTLAGEIIRLTRRQTSDERIQDPDPEVIAAVFKNFFAVEPNRRERRHLESWAIEAANNSYISLYDAAYVAAAKTDSRTFLERARWIESRREESGGFSAVVAAASEHFDLSTQFFLMGRPSSKQIRDFIRLLLKDENFDVSQETDLWRLIVQVLEAKQIEDTELRLLIQDSFEFRGDHSVSWKFSNEYLLRASDVDEFISRLKFVLETSSDSVVTHEYKVLNELIAHNSIELYASIAKSDEDLIQIIETFSVKGPLATALFIESLISEVRSLDGLSYFIKMAKTHKTRSDVNHSPRIAKHALPVVFELLEGEDLREALNQLVPTQKEAGRDSKLDRIRADALSLALETQIDSEDFVNWVHSYWPDRYYLTRIYPQVRDTWKSALEAQPDIRPRLRTRVRQTCVAVLVSAKRRLAGFVDGGSQ